jgi:hypothetical protein
VSIGGSLGDKRMSDRTAPKIQRARTVLDVG